MPFGCGTLCKETAAWFHLRNTNVVETVSNHCSARDHRQTIENYNNIYISLTMSNRPNVRIFGRGMRHPESQCSATHLVASRKAPQKKTRKTRDTFSPLHQRRCRWWQSCNGRLVAVMSNNTPSSSRSSTIRNSKTIWFRAVLVGYLGGYLSGFWSFYDHKLPDHATRCSPTLNDEAGLLTVPRPPAVERQQDENISEDSEDEEYEENGVRTSNQSQPTRKRDSLWYKKYVANMTRVFEPWNGDSTYSWCIPEDPNNPSPPSLHSGTDAVGLIYIKSYKTASSTLEGICLSIAHNIARRHFNSSQTPCIHYNRHEFADKRHHQRRGNPSILYSFVRQPDKRDLSHVFHFEVGRKNMEPTDKAIINAIEYRIKGRQVRYLVPQKSTTAKLWPKHEIRKDPDKVAKIIHKRIIKEYSFLGITERMEESLAVMKILWKLETGDVVVLPAKRSGGYDDAGHENKCTRIPKAFRSPAVGEYLRDKYIRNNGDVLLYDVVNKSLDMTIDAIGRSKVESVVKEIRYLQQLAESTCQAKAIFPCSEDGQAQLELSERSCYVQDAGCGHECVDSVMEQYRQNLPAH